MKYERFTAASISAVLQHAQALLTARLPLTTAKSGSHSVTLSGGDGTVTIEAHRHGLDTLVAAATDQLRTSRLDADVQYFMQSLPYQPGDPVAGGEALPGGLSEMRRP
jgi:hypothetical protein